MPFYSLVIPVYKSNKSLEIIASEVENLQNSQKYTFEIVFVNDSPFDLETVRTLNSLEKNYSNVKIVTLRKNNGQQFAILCGLKEAVGDYIITLDDDLQHPIKEIPKLIEAFHADPEIDAIFAIPDFRDRNHNIWRNLGSYFLNQIDGFFLKKPKGLYKSPFRIMSAELVEVILQNYNAMPAVSSLIIYATNNIKNIKVEHANREFGKSNYTLPKLFNHTLNNLIQYSSIPLKALGLVGAIVFFASLLFIIFILFRKTFIGIELPGYASTVSLISFFGGLNLFALGLIGEYLIRIMREQQKPNLEDMVKKSKSNYRQLKTVKEVNI